MMGWGVEWFSFGHGLFLLVFLVIAGIPFWRIVQRTGMNPVLSLLWFVPLVNVIWLWVFAFAEWPALKQDTAK